MLEFAIQAANLGPAEASSSAVALVDGGEGMAAAPGHMLRRADWEAPLQHGRERHRAGGVHRGRSFFFEEKGRSNIKHL